MRKTHTQKGTQARSGLFPFRKGGPLKWREEKVEGGKRISRSLPRLSSAIPTMRRGRRPLIASSSSDFISRRVIYDRPLAAALNSPIGLHGTFADLQVTSIFCIFPLPSSSSFRPLSFILPPRPFPKALMGSPAISSWLPVHRCGGKDLISTRASQSTEDCTQLFQHSRIDWIF